MNTATEAPKSVFEVTVFPAIIFGYQSAPGSEPFIFWKHVPGIDHAAAEEKVWDLVFGLASKYSKDTFRLQSPSIGRPLFSDAPRAPWIFVDQNHYNAFAFAGILTDCSNSVWGAPMQGQGDGWGFCERVAHVLFGDEAAQKVSDILKSLHEGAR